MLRNLLLMLLIVFFGGSCSNLALQDMSDSEGVDLSALKEFVFKTSAITGIGVEKNVNRRDPSDIVKIGTRYYVFYTRLQRGDPVFPEGYYGTIWYASSKDRGHNWTEQGCVINKGSKGKFDSFGAFTPNVIKGIDGELYLYYTGVGDNFDNKHNDYSIKNRTAIGVARLYFDEAGNIIGVVKINEGNPVLLPSKAGSGKFDSFRVDDSALTIREGKYWLYYKGRRFKGTPRQTQMGLAVAEKPQGPYVKLNGGEPIQKEGHEVMIWNYGEGVLSVVSNVGRGIYYSADGVVLEKISSDFEGRINAPGAYRPELTDHQYRKGATWGISMVHATVPYLVRWEIKTSKPTGSRADESK